jgi:hypothetical protein
MFVLWYSKDKKPGQRSTNKVQRNSKKEKFLLGAWMFVVCECCVLLGRGLCE